MGFVIEGLTPKAVKVKQTAPEKLWVHDEHNPHAARLLASLFAPEFPIPLGVLSEQTDQPVYEQLTLGQEEAAIKEKGAGSLEKLLHSGETWTI